MEERRYKEKVEKKHIEEIKQLLKEFRNITDIKDRIREWRDEGYNVDELEQMIEFVGIEKSEIEKYCSDCGHTVPDDANTCPYCGEKFDNSEKKTCSSCGHENTADGKFCKECGNKL